MYSHGPWPQDTSVVAVEAVGVKEAAARTTAPDQCHKALMVVGAVCRVVVGA